jgi:hypothetical protein
MLVIGNWDGGPGQQILLPIKRELSLRERRALGRQIVIALNEAGLPSFLYISGDKEDC